MGYYKKPYHFFKPSVCCGYGMDGMKTSGYDCVTIPGAAKTTADMKGVVERICGRKFVTVNEDMVSKTVCSKLI